jgi:TatD DNase family protein
MGLIDTHAHLADPAFATQIDEVLTRARNSGVDKILCVGTTAATSREAIGLAQAHDMLYASVGIHPTYSHQASESDWNLIESLVDDARVVALGETGLDRYWEDCPWDIQVDFFHRHWNLSRRTGLPVIIHSRDCDEEMVENLHRAAESGPLVGVMHAFSGSLKTAEACLGLGLHISFAGMVTYKKSTDLRKVAEAVPLDRILIETDSPYLSPEPRRAIRPNEPSLVIHTAECLAGCRKMEIEEFSNVTSQNARRLFKLPTP